jgi:NDP-sugar pyrophosphorylase family protein
MINTIIPAAGNGKRFVSAGVKTIKPLLVVNEKTLIEHAIDIVSPIGGEVFVITKVMPKEKDNKTLSKTILDNKANEIFVPTNKNHSGAAHSASFAKIDFMEKDLIESPLIIINCDQIIKLDYENFFSFINKNDPDGVVILYESYDPKNSFAKIEDGKIVEIIEKNVISNDALTGFHYWKRSGDFFDSASELQEKLYGTLHEEYVSETYNFLIKRGKKIMPYFIDNQNFIPLGTPEDVDKYLGNDQWRNS